jgi:hypothetical protein
VKRPILVAIAFASCGGQNPPTVDAFTVDNANPQAGAEVHLSYVVRGATSISILPAPGAVTSSPVTVLPIGPTVYTLNATNSGGTTSRQLTVNAPRAAPASIVQFSLVPSQAPAGTQRVLSWKISHGSGVTLQGGGLGTKTITTETQISDAPLATATYTLSATSLTGVYPASVTARAVARVVPAASISFFTATPVPPAPPVLPLQQGDAAQLSWDGTALGWAVTASGITTNLGVKKSLVVRPSTTTTYSLTGTGPGGAAGPQQLTVSVKARAGTTLVYTPPTVTTEKLQLVADPCSPTACTAMTLRLMAAAAPVALRGVVIDLPLDSTKISLDPATFAAPFVTDASPAAKAALGTGPLKNTLVLGAALKGSGTAPATDRSLAAAAEVLHFSVALQQSGGQGIVFDGATAFVSFIQSFSGRTPGGIAVGRLEAK